MKTKWAFSIFRDWPKFVLPLYLNDQERQVYFQSDWHKRQLSSMRAKLIQLGLITKAMPHKNNPQPAGAA